MTLTSLPGTANAVRLSTEEAAERLKVKPQTLRAALCRDGHYLGARPLKSANRFLLWPGDEVELLAAGAGRIESSASPSAKVTA